MKIILFEIDAELLEPELPAKPFSMSLADKAKFGALIRKLAATEEKQNA